MRYGLRYPTEKPFHFNPVDVDITTECNKKNVNQVSSFTEMYTDRLCNEVVNL